MHLKQKLVTGARSLWVASLLGIGLSSCQVVFGDFHIDDTDLGRSISTECEPNGFRCRGATLERCRDNRTGFDRYLTCESAGACDPTAGACRPCAAGELSCNDGVLQACGADGSWSPRATCELPALCHVDPSRMTGQCNAPACAPGTFACQGGRLLGCARTRDRFVLVEDCGSDARCSAAAAAEAVAAKAKPHCLTAECGDACPPAACPTPGAARCSTVVPAVELCGTDGQWVVREACETEKLCHRELGLCLPPACAPDERRCLGQKRQVCSADQDRFEDVETCPEATTCTPAACEPMACVEGEVRCNGASFERCQAGKFVPLNRCATPSLCKPELASAGGCEPPTCGEELPHYRCVGQILSDCLPGRHGWREITTCPSGSTCDVEAGRCAQMP